MLGYATCSSTFGQPTWGGVAADSSTAYATVWAVSLKEGSRGSLLWTKDIQVPSGNITLQLGTVDPVNRMFFVSTKETSNGTAMTLTTETKFGVQLVTLAHSTITQPSAAVVLHKSAT